MKMKMVEKREGSEVHGNRAVRGVPPEESSLIMIEICPFQEVS